MSIKAFYFVVSLTLLSCGASNEKTSLIFSGGVRTIDTIPPGEVLSFNQVNSLVIAPKCLSCHSVGGGDAGGINLETHAKVITYLGQIKSEVNLGTMPPRNKPALTANEKNILLSWVNAGGPIDATTPPKDPTPPPTVEVINYEIVKKQVLAPRCIGCHSDEGGNRGDVNLETYENVVSLANSIEEEIESGSMPPRQRHLTPEQKTLILKWIKMGLPKD